MATYTNHKEVLRLDSLGKDLSRIRTNTRNGYFSIDSKELKKVLTDSNVIFLMSECRKLKAMIRNDSPVLLETDFDGEVGVSLTLTKTKAILLLMGELNDILEKRIEQIEATYDLTRIKHELTRNKVSLSGF